MNRSHTGKKTSRIQISIVAGYQLVRESLAHLIESNNSLTVISVSGFTSNTAGLIGAKSADVVVIYLDPGDPVEVVTDILEASPQTRVVVITGSDDLDCQTTALKLGAVGIVRAEQDSKLLFDAINQAFKGETWLNQALLSKLLEGGAVSGRLRENGTKAPTAEALTPRETEVIAMIGKGLKSKVIATRLSISEATVRHHLSSIYGKLGVEDRLNLIIYAYEKGLIDLPVGTTDQ